MSQASTQASSADEAVDAAGVRALSGRIAGAWAENDGTAFADVFTEDATVILPGDVFLRGRAEIRTYMTAAYAGPYRGTRVTGDPRTVTFLSEDACVMVTYGGVLVPGETEVAAARAIRATWVCVRRDGDWHVAAYQNTPVNTPS
ncbi:SgcJ/EcaC family oxidoreductase [Streptomyces sedi]|uniref:SgcJ/EcaC family oxidoreductase n=1 Tax=Streptomyces sedi TaxID=555059 RepID=A0A5C4VES1_9ACTN|nr:SgcJ/EcaC family oxidoreductase [Streptomyces sedi]TNM34331.1 SgcJ/EcaC family oxidoreductase [Streptomyces sedi]